MILVRLAPLHYSWINKNCSNIDSHLLRDEDLKVIKKFSCLEAKRLIFMRFIKREKSLKDVM